MNRYYITEFNNTNKMLKMNYVHKLYTNICTRLLFNAHITH